MGGQLRRTAQAPLDKTAARRSPKASCLTDCSLLYFGAPPNLIHTSTDLLTYDPAPFGIAPTSKSRCGDCGGELRRLWRQAVATLAANCGDSGSCGGGGSSNGGNDGGGDGGGDGGSNGDEDKWQMGYVGVRWIYTHADVLPPKRPCSRAPKAVFACLLPHGGRLVADFGGGGASGEERDVLDPARPRGGRVAQERVRAVAAFEHELRVVKRADKLDRGVGDLLGIAGGLRGDEVRIRRA
eukprot:4480266-Pleurochrysis_carterae.AAC.1